MLKTRDRRSKQYEAVYKLFFQGPCPPGGHRPHQHFPVAAQGLRRSAAALSGAHREILTKYKQDGDWAAYVEKYEKDVLGKLRQETIMQEITRLSGRKDAAILCFERDPAQCHRSLVARWLRKAGYEIAEYGV